MKARLTTIPRKSTSPKTNARRPTLAVMKPPAEPVLFQYHDADTRRVCIAGSFNDWRPDGLEMIALGGGRWAKELLLAPGAYEYCLVIDGEWKQDPAAGRTVPNPFGGANSLLIVGGGQRPPQTVLRRST